MQQISTGMSDFSTTTPLFATAFWVAWITAVYSGDTVLAPSINAYATTSAMFSISTFALGATLVTSGIAAKQTEKLISKKIPMYAMAATCALSTIASNLDALLPAPIFIACAAMTGISSAFIAIRSIRLYAEVSTKKAAIASSLSLALGVLIYAQISLMAVYFSTSIVILAVATLPFFAVFASFIPTNEYPMAVDDASKSLSPAFWRLAAFLAIIAFCVSTVRGMYPRLLSIEEFSASRCQISFGLLAMAVIIIAIIASKPKSYPFGRLFYWLFVSSVLLILPIGAAGIDSPAMGTLSSIANGLLFLMAWNFLARVSFCSGMSSIRVFGFGYGTASIGMTLGFVTGELFSERFASFDRTIFAMMLLCACLVAVLVLLREKDVSSCMTPTDAIKRTVYELGQKDSEGEADNTRDPAEETALPQESGGGGKGRFQMKCNAVIERFDLTPREAEVFSLLARHKEAQAIADELFISFNTARTHIRKIYAKLNVHSRRELLDLIDNQTCQMPTQKSDWHPAYDESEHAPTEQNPDL